MLQARLNKQNHSQTDKTIPKQTNYLHNRQKIELDRKNEILY